MYIGITRTFASVAHRDVCCTVWDSEAQAWFLGIVHLFGRAQASHSVVSGYLIVVFLLDNARCSDAFVWHYRLLSVFSKTSVSWLAFMHGPTLLVARSYCMVLFLRVVLSAFMCFPLYSIFALLSHVGNLARCAKIEAMDSILQYLLSRSLY